MSAEVTYRGKMDRERLEKLRMLQKDLPVICTKFFHAVSQTTSTLTRLAYAYDFRIFFQYLCAESPVFGQFERPELITAESLKQVTAHDIEEFQDYLMQYYKQTDNGQEVIISNHELGIMRKLSSIRSLFEYLFKNGYLESNVTTLVQLPKLHQKPIIRLDQKEMEKMIHAASTGDGLTQRQEKFHQLIGARDYAMIMLFLGTGIRVSECVGINLGDIDFSMNAFMVTRKGGNQVILYFPDEVADALKAYIAEREKITPLPGSEDALFLSMQKKRMTQRAVQLMVKKYAAIASPLKPKISPHKLRSTYGTNLYQETGDIYLVADVLGHADVNTTRKHYADMTDSRRREAAQFVKLPGQK